jgi:hypothetical protein
MEKPQSQQMARKVANQAKWQRRGKKSSTSRLKLKNSQTPPNNLNPSSPPLIYIIVFLLSTTRLGRVQPTLCIISPPLVMNSSNTFRKKNEMVCMRSKLGYFTRYTSKYLSNYTQSLCQDLQNKSESAQGDNKEITSK